MVTPLTLLRSRGICSLLLSAALGAPLLTISMAGKAIAWSAIRTLHPVVRGHGVTPLTATLRTRQSPVNILLVRYRLQMVRTNTCFVPTQVVQVQSFRDRTDERLVHHTMSVECLRLSITSDTELRVTALRSEERRVGKECISRW